MGPLWQRHGLPAEPASGRYRYLHVDVCPPSLQDPRGAGIDNVQLMRPEPVDASRAAPVALPWLETAGARPLVYMTLGTVPLFNQLLSLFGAAIEGLRDDDVELVAALWDNDPADLGPQPANVHVERSIPQSAVLARAAAAVVHGGPGSTVAALAYGVPLLVLPPEAPIFNRVADAVARSGAGRVLAAAEATPDAFRREVRLLLEDPTYRQAAARVRDEIDGMPTPASVVKVLERLAAG
jgi:MGT family glycosyltransferase